MEDSPAPAPAPRSAPPSSIGERLRAGRERAGLSVAAAAEKLHLDVKVIEALEANRFAELGASVYVRGHLRRYGDFVGEHGAELVNNYSARSEARPPPPDLTQVPHPERRADPRRLVTPLVGLGCALVLAIAIWWVLAGSHSGAASGAAGSDQAVPANSMPAASLPAAPSGATPAAAPSAMRMADTAPGIAPTNAGGTPAAADPAANAARREASPEANQAPARVTRLTLELSGESWVEVYDTRGERLFYDVASAGSVQRIEGRAPLRVVLGNAAGVSVQVDGQARDIPSGAVSGEGARFVVNRSGSLSRARP